MTARRLAIVLTLIGLAIALYLSAVHYSQESVPLLCSSSGLVNCAEVTSSPQSMIGPLPVAALGVLWFGVMLGLEFGQPRREGVSVPQAASLPGARIPPHVSADQTLTPGDPCALARLLWATVGLLVVFYLIYAELFLVGAICLWCSAVHLLVIALFLIQLAEFTSREQLEGKGG